MPIAIKRYKDGSYTPLTKPWTRRIDYGGENHVYPKKKKGIVRRLASKLLDNTANGIIRGAGGPDNYYKSNE